MRFQAAEYEALKEKHHDRNWKGHLSLLIREHCLCPEDALLWSPHMLLERLLAIGKTTSKISYLEPVVKLRAIDWVIETTLSAQGGNCMAQNRWATSSAALDEAMRGLCISTYEVS